MPDLPARPGPGPDQPTRSREQTRERLLDGAYQAFVEIGFSASTVEDVCSRAGYTRGAFYSNFGTMDELFLALWDRQDGRLLVALRTLVEAVGNADAPDEPFERAMETIIALRAPDRDWFVIGTEMMLHALRTPGLAERLHAQRLAFRAELKRGIEVLLAAQGRRTPDGIDLETFAQLLIAGHVGCRHVSATDPTGGPGLPMAMLQVLMAACPEIDPD